ncbi:Dosage compensation regulator [Gryllus bimaculatus]|nr:Dosage compensation regulator [Gryllus bimaculatus]
MREFRSNDGEERRARLKVEMKTLFMSQESEDLLLDTMKELHGKNFCLRDISAYKDKGENLSKLYWMDRGHLIVQGGIDYSKPKDSVSMKDQVNKFALARLQGYGFHKSHCAEALEITDGDVGTALEVLASKYFRVQTRFPNVKKLQEDEDEEGKELNFSGDLESAVEQMKEEKCVLESIYESLFEERIANRVWLLHLEIPYLIDLYVKPKKNLEIGKEQRKPKKEAEICRFFAKGHCKFATGCRNSHILPNSTTTETKKKVEAEEKFVFNLEIRFPEGLCYPAESPLIYLSTNCPKVPADACLRLARRLQQEAMNCSQSEQPCVYTVTQILLEKQEEMLEILKVWRGDFPLPEEKLFPDVKGKKNSLNGMQVDSNFGHNSRGQRAGKSQQNMKEVMRENSRIIQKFFEMQDSCPKYQKMVEARAKLPAWAKCEDILSAIDESQVVVISGETGCGKSTQVPQFLLDQWLTGACDDEHREIVCTQPRRISAIGVAERVADERADRIGGVVGYQIRLESKTSSSTRLLFCTTGILLRRLEGDPNLSSITHIIVDEVHERSEESDFLLMILRDLLQVRKDLKVVLMSATLNANLFSSYFGKVPIIEIPGRTFPVQQFFLEDTLDIIEYALEENSQYCRDIKKPFSDSESFEVELAVADQKTAVIPNPATRDEHLTISQMNYRYDGYSVLTKKCLYLMDGEKINYDLIESLLVWIVKGTHKFPRSGTILIDQFHGIPGQVFLPGLAEIQTLYDQINDNPILGSRGGQISLLPLHSTLSSEEQAAVFKKPKGGARKIVLSTNIAETSVTIDDCVFVVDCGRMKEKRFDSNRNMESLELVWVSQANAQQRKGRAGRVMAGVCFHLFTKHRFDFHFLKQPIPELHRRTLEPPPADSIDSALQRLKDVGAMDLQNNLTALGRHLAALPVDVRIGKLIIYGAIFCCVDSSLTIAACLSHKSPFVAPFGKKELADSRKKTFAVGNSDQLTVLKAYKHGKSSACEQVALGKLLCKKTSCHGEHLSCWQTSNSSLLELACKHWLCVPRHCQATPQSGSDIVLPKLGLSCRTNCVKEFQLMNECSLKKMATVWFLVERPMEKQPSCWSLLCAALYPQVVQVLTHEKSYLLPVQQVFLHPSSINYTVTHFTSPYLVYQEKVKTSRVFIRDTSMVPLLPLVLFSGCGLTVEMSRGEFVLALADGWIKFLVEKHNVAELIKMIRSEFVDLLAKKIEDPSLDLLTHERGKKIVRTIIHLVTRG